MAAISTCHDTSECVDFFKPLSLYLKPISRISCTVQLPQLKLAGMSISNWDVMEKLKMMVKPFELGHIRVVKTSSDFLRFEADLANREHLCPVLDALDNKTMKLSGFPELLKIRAAESKAAGPSKHDWESFFRDAPNMNELKFGERADTVVIQQLPVRWFAQPTAEGTPGDKPSDALVRKAFSTFGKVRAIDVPTLEQRQLMNRTVSNLQPDVLFDAFVQYLDYPEFVRAMTNLRGMKLVHLEAAGNAHEAAITIDFDRTKHLTDKFIRRRRLEAEKWQLLNRAKELKEIEDTETEQTDKQQRRREREKKRLAAAEGKKVREQEEEMSIRIQLEERKITVAQRKLESIRLLTYLFERIKGDVEPDSHSKSDKRDKKKTDTHDRRRSRSNSPRRRRIPAQEQERVREKIEQNYRVEVSTTEQKDYRRQHQLVSHRMSDHRLPGGRNTAFGNRFNRGYNRGERSGGGGGRGMGGGGGGGDQITFQRHPPVKKLIQDIALQQLAEMIEAPGPPDRRRPSNHRMGGGAGSGLPLSNRPPRSPDHKESRRRTNSPPHRPASSAERDTINVRKAMDFVPLRESRRGRDDRRSPKRKESPRKPPVRKESPPQKKRQLRRRSRSSSGSPAPQYDFSNHTQKNVSELHYDKNEEAEKRRRYIAANAEDFSD